MTKLCHNVDDHTILDEFDNEQSRLSYYPLDYLKIAVVCLHYKHSRISNFKAFLTNFVNMFLTTQSLVTFDTRHDWTIECILTL